MPEDVSGIEGWVLEGGMERVFDNIWLSEVIENDMGHTSDSHGMSIKKSSSENKS